MENKKENQKQKIYWCQCFDVNQRIAKISEKIIKDKDTGKTCSKCGGKIFEATKK